MTRKLKVGERAFEDVDHEFVRLKLVDTYRFKDGVMVFTCGGAQ
jgi:hypothetical protein